METEWINSNERLPEPDTIVLAVFDTKITNRQGGEEISHTAYVAPTTYNKNEIWGGWSAVTTRRYDIWNRIPFWMPKPELPEELKQYLISDKDLNKPIY